MLQGGRHLPDERQACAAQWQPRRLTLICAPVCVDMHCVVGDTICNNKVYAVDGRQKFFYLSKMHSTVGVSLTKQNIPTSLSICLTIAPRILDLGRVDFLP
jgi:hypothetical protein